MTDPAHADALTVPATPRGQAWIREEIARARREALEEAARMVDCACDNRAAVLAETNHNSAARWNACGRDPCGALDAAAIRALMDKEPPA